MITSIYSVMLLLWATLPLGPAADPGTYLDTLKTELKKEWPNNRTINLVFHGHSVPAGYFKTPVVNTLEAYPYQLLRQIKARYPHAVVNVINTSIGGENSQRGEKRFLTEVIPHRPDVLFIDYALNDRGIGLGEARRHWDSMISEALKRNIKVILLTPSPDQRVDLLATGNELEQHALQIEQLATAHGIGLADSYGLFKKQVQHGENVADFMSQVNHPNSRGHALIADELMTFFE
jgi:acyl-CoA thioesterase-1